MKSYSEVVSECFRKPARRFFVFFLGFCIALSFLAVLQIAGRNEYWYFCAGAAYCSIFNVLLKATESWRRR